MKIESKRFGTIEVREDRILTLKGGLLGFNQLTNFILVDDQEDPSLPFKWLIAIDQPEHGFLVTDPGIFFKDYVFDLSEEDGKALEVGSEDDVTVISLLTVPADPSKITANLKGPLVFNNRTREGKQVVLADSGYSTKHFIFLQEALGSDVTTEAGTAQAAHTSSTLTANEASANTEVKA